METKLLEEKIDALNANLEKILGLMDRLGGYSKLSLEQAIEQRVDDLKIKKETLEETIRNNKECIEETKRHDKAMENYNPLTAMGNNIEEVEKFTKMIVAAQDKARNDEDEWWKGNENG